MIWIVGYLCIGLLVGVVFIEATRWDGYPVPRSFILKVMLASALLWLYLVPKAFIDAIREE